MSIVLLYLDRSLSDRRRWTCVDWCHLGQNRTSAVILVNLYVTSVFPVAVTVPGKEHSGIAGDGVICLGKCFPTNETGFRPSEAIQLNVTSASS